MADETVIDLKIQPDEKTNDKSKKTLESYISLISDLAIIGKVAGEVLGKIWKEAGKSIDVGVKNFTGSINAMVRGFSDSGFMKLTEAMANIGAAGKEGSVVSGIDQLIRGIQNPELRDKEIERLYSTLGKGGIEQGAQDRVVNALKSGVAEDALMAIAAAMQTVPEGQRGKISDILADLNLGALATLEDPEQYDDFMKIMSSSSIVYERNIETLDELNDSLSKFKMDVNALRNAFAEDLTPAVSLFSEKMREFTEWYLEFRQDVKAAREEFETGEEYVEKRTDAWASGQWIRDLLGVEGDSSDAMIDPNYTPRASRSEGKKLRSRLEAYNDLMGYDYRGNQVNLEDYIETSLESKGVTIEIDNLNLSEIRDNYDLIEQLLNSVIVDFSVPK